MDRNDNDEFFLIDTSFTPDYPCSYCPKVDIETHEHLHFTILLLQRLFQFVNPSVKEHLESQRKEILNIEGNFNIDERKAIRNQIIDLCKQVDLNST